MALWLRRFAHVDVIASGWLALGPIANAYVTTNWWIELVADLKEVMSVGQV
jgi:hypothetical protein